MDVRNEVIHAMRRARISTPIEAPRLKTLIAVDKH